MRNEVQASHPQVDDPVFLLQRIAELEQRMEELEGREGELRANLARHQTITGLITDCLFTLTLTGEGVLHLAWASEGFARVVGYTPDEISALGGWRQVVAEEDWPLVERCLPLLAAGGSASEELRLQDHHGRPHWVRFHVQVEGDAADPNTLHLLCAAKSVDAEKRALIGLEVQKELFEGLIAVARATTEQSTLEITLQNTLDVATRLTGASHASIFLLDETGAVTHGILGRGRTERAQQDQIVGRVMDKGLAGWVARHREPVVVQDTTLDSRWVSTLYETYSVRSALVVPILRKEVLLGILTLTHSVSSHFGDEALRWMAAAADQMALALDNARLYASVQQELAERRRAESELREIATRLETVCNTTNDGVWEWNFLTHKLTWSERLLAIVGTSARTLRGNPTKLLYRRIHPDDFAIAQPLLLAHLSDPNEGAFRIECRFRGDSGQYTWIHITGQAIRDEKGRPLRLIGSITDITERKLFENRLTHQAFHDPLTGLPNRVLFMDRLEQAIAYANRWQKSVALLFLDLNEFKSVNDRYGHAVGDALLQLVAARLLSCVRRTDTVARLSGDEFILLLPQVSGVSDAVKVAEQVARALSEPFQFDAHQLHTTTSIGISLYPRDGFGASELIENADMAMYHAKQHGLIYQVFTSDLHIIGSKRLALESDLRQALARDEMRLYYQPEIDLATGRVRGVEALIRWQHPVHGLLPPASFLPLAEELGLLLPLGRWVLEEACAQLRDWRLPPPLTISINLSARQLASSDFLQEIPTLLQTLDLAPQQLQIEISENELMREADHLLPTLQFLHHSGVRLAIDDFGAGFSSLRYLKRFPVSVVKMDRRFVNLLNNPAEDIALLSGIIAMAHKFELSVVAKGVEFDYQRIRLQDLHCDTAQGYLLGRPLAADTFGDTWKLGGS